MLTAMSHWPCSKSLVSATLSILDPYWDSSWMPCCCPVLCRSCSFGSAGQKTSICNALTSKWATEPGEMGQQFRVHAALAEKLSLGSSTYIRLLQGMQHPLLVSMESCTQILNIHRHDILRGPYNSEMDYLFRLNFSKLCSTWKWDLCMEDGE